MKSTGCTLLVFSFGGSARDQKTPRQQSRTHFISTGDAPQLEVHRPALQCCSDGKCSGAPFGRCQLVSPVASLCQNVFPVPYDSQGRHPCTLKQTHGRRKFSREEGNYAHVRMRVHVCVCVYVCMCMCVCVCVHVCARVWVGGIRGVWLCVWCMCVRMGNAGNMAERERGARCTVEIEPVACVRLTDDLSTCIRLRRFN